jgi:hypothetical protein
MLYSLQNVAMYGPAGHATISEMIPTEIGKMLNMGRMRADLMHQLQTRSLLWVLVLLLTVGCSACSLSTMGPGSEATPTPVVPTASASQSGMTVYDGVNKVTWLADANLAATQRFGLPICGVSNTTPCVNATGSMSYQAAMAWIAAMNAAHYLGHTNWQLPTTPLDDQSCTYKGPSGGNFGYNCVHSAMGALYAKVLDLKAPNSAVPIPNNKVGPFSDFQPYLYWSGTQIGTGPGSNGFYAFSFATGHLGSNINEHYMYVLPMIKGKLPGKYSPAGIHDLQISVDGQTIYDPDATVGGVAGVTWLADADLAKTQSFGSQCVKPNGSRCINPDGSMTHTTAEKWIAGMNAYHGGAGWLGHTDWELPPSIHTDTTCDQEFYGYGCTGSPMGELFYDQLGLKPGSSVIQPSTTQVGSFHNLQPYLYWSCVGAPDSQSPCTTGAPAPGFEFSFSFGNGFEGTDPGGPHIAVGNGLYVIAYYPG